MSAILGGMALFIRQDEQRSKLQERIATEMQERAKTKALAPPPDGVDDSRFIEGTKRTTSLAWAWFVVAGLFIAAIIFIVVLSITKKS